MIVNRPPGDIRVKNRQPVHRGGGRYVCSETENTYAGSLLGGPVIGDGEDFLRLSPTVKSNHVDATPHSFVKTELSNPSWDAVTVNKQKNPARTEQICDGYTTSSKTFDGAAMYSITVRELNLPVIPPGIIADVDSMSILKAQASLRKAAGSLPMLYRERKESVKTLGTYSKAILNNVITMQRKDVKRWLAAVKRHKRRPDRLKKVANDIADRHLEFVFGVLPLIDDILGLTELITEKKLDFRTGRGRHTYVNRTVKVQALPLKWQLPAFLAETDIIERYSVRTGLRMDIDSTILNTASLLGFNPIYTRYDMTPLSFVVGWFSNLNLWLQSLDATPGLSFRTGYSTKRTELLVARNIRGFTNRVGETDIVGDGNGHHFGNIVRQTRTVHSSMPGIQPWQFLDNASFFAAAASVSLAVQRLVKTANHEITVRPFRYRGPRIRNLPPIKYRR